MSLVQRMIGTAIVLSMSAVPCAAQGVRGGIKVGGAFTSLSNAFVLTEASEDESAVHTGVAMGGFVEVALSPRVSFQPEVFIMTKGADLPDDSAGDAIAIRYLEVPALIKFAAQPGRGMYGMYFVAGPNIGFKLDAKIQAEGDEDEDIGDRVKSTEWGMTFGLGIQGGHWLLEGRFSQGLSNIATDESEPRVKTRSVALVAGIRF